MSTPEGRVKAGVKKMLKGYPSVYQFWPVQSGYGAKTLDCILCVAGFFVSVETKAPGKRPTELQEKTIGDMQRAGGIVLVIDGPEGIARLENLIKELYHHAITQPDPGKRQAQDAGSAVSDRRCKSIPRRRPAVAQRCRASACAARPGGDVHAAQARLSGAEPDPHAL